MKLKEAGALAGIIKNAAVLNLSGGCPWQIYWNVQKKKKKRKEKRGEKAGRWNSECFFFFVCVFIRHIEPALCEGWGGSKELYQHVTDIIGVWNKPPCIKFYVWFCNGPRHVIFIPCASGARQAISSRTSLAAAPLYLLPSPGRPCLSGMDYLTASCFISPGGHGRCDKRQALNNVSEGKHLLVL